MAVVGNACQAVLKLLQGENELDIPFALERLAEAMELHSGDFEAFSVDDVTRSSLKRELLPGFPVYHLFATSLGRAHCLAMLRAIAAHRLRHHDPAP